ncbi:hypothetical protein RVX_R26980 [Nitratidesulfovibrio sp. HK-II]|uniref:hypothetical protein n=1 Tax=Nitratidesulfovibrio sp. HK-II TaxID=2009266 RepID=UPI003A74ADD7
MSEPLHLAPIPGFDGYQVTQDGTVTGPRGRALKPNRSGYVGIYRDGKQIWTPASELVALAWGTPAKSAAPQPEADAALLAELDLLREAVATLEADLSTVTRQRDKALRQRDALAATRLIEVAQPTSRTRRVRQ